LTISRHKCFNKPMSKITNIDQEQDFFGITGDVFRLWRPCWEVLRLNLPVFAFIALVPLVLFVLILALVIMPWLMTSSFTLINIISAAFLGLLLLAAGVLLWPAMIITQIDSAKNKKVDFSQAVKQAVKVALPFLGLTILIGLITLLGFVLLLIPGFLAIFFLCMAPYIYIDKKVGVVAAIKQSYKLVKANWRLVFAVFIVNFAISFVSIVPFFGSIANIVLTIIYFCLPALIYMQIRR
jgi:hypothetical protein